MLVLTDTAAEVISELTAQLDLPETAGLRICPNPEEGGEAALAAVLSDKILDAETQDGGRVMFHVRSQVTPDEVPGSA
jgi:hypothetical protein